MNITTNFDVLDFNSTDIDKLIYNNTLVWQKLNKKTIADSSSISYEAYPLGLINYKIEGNIQQASTPTEANPVYPQGCGVYDSQTETYNLPITISNGTDSSTHIVPLGSEPLCLLFPSNTKYIDSIDYKTKTLTRYMKKIVLTGNENWVAKGTSSGRYQYFQFKVGELNQYYGIAKCSHYVYKLIDEYNNNIGISFSNIQSLYDPSGGYIMVRPSDYSSLNSFKTFLQNQNTNGTPVVVWISLSTPIIETISMPDLPTYYGNNTLTVGGTIPPKGIEIEGRII